MSRRCPPGTRGQEPLALHGASCLRSSTDGVTDILMRIRKALVFPDYLLVIVASLRLSNQTLAHLTDDPWSPEVKTRYLVHADFVQEELKIRSIGISLSIDGCEISALHLLFVKKSC